MIIIGPDRAEKVRSELLQRKIAVSEKTAGHIEEIASEFRAIEVVFLEERLAEIRGVSPVLVQPDEIAPGVGRFGDGK